MIHAKTVETRCGVFDVFSDGCLQWKRRTHKDSCQIVALLAAYKAARFGA
jgi:hypothetical protein